MRCIIRMKKSLIRNVYCLSEKVKIKYLIPREFMQPHPLRCGFVGSRSILKVKLHGFEIRIWMGDREYILYMLSIIRNYNRHTRTENQNENPKYFPNNILISI